MANKKVTITYNGSQILPETELTNSTIIYNGTILASDFVGTKTLNCNGQVMVSNITVGTKTLNCNGQLMMNNIKIESKVVTDPLCFTANSAGSTIGMSVTGTPIGKDFKYSTDNITWSAFTPGTTTITLANAGDRVYFKGNNPYGLNENGDNHYTFTMTGSIAASGSIMSLIDNGTCSNLIIPNNYCFICLFLKCSALTSAPELPATTLTNFCYWQMFWDCSSLTTAPELPATTLALACYWYMFYGCRKLIEAPELPATTLADTCYGSMFAYCTSLTKVPKLLATTLIRCCYERMFAGCTALQVSDTQTATASYAWTIPSSGTFTNTYNQASMFSSCTGTRSSNDMPGVAGQSYTYYTQNTPI